MVRSTIEVTRLYYVPNDIEKTTREGYMMNNYEQLNSILVDLFDHTMDIEQKFLVTGKFKDISVNDMHIIDAIGIKNKMNMTSLAKKVGVTVGTLTIAINGLVRKEYVTRSRSTEDRRVVLVSLTHKGEAAFEHHADFHRQIVNAIHSVLDEEECRTLVKGLSSLKQYFDHI